MRKVMAVAVLLALAISACGSKSSPKESSEAPGGGSGGNSEFSKLIAKTNAATYKVTYQSGGSTSFTIAQKPPLFSYREGTTSTYVTSDGSAVSCSGTGASATCTSLPGSGDSIKQGLSSAFGALGAALVASAGKGIPGLSSISKTSSKTIAGRDAACATIDSGSLGALGATIKGSYSVCVDKATGVMLESSATDPSGKVSEIKATAFGEPTDADLTPPSPPVTIPGLPTTPST
jgi:hypothetical protein